MPASVKVIVKTSYTFFLTWVEGMYSLSRTQSNATPEAGSSSPNSFWAASVSPPTVKDLR